MHSNSLQHFKILVSPIRNNSRSVKKSDLNCTGTPKRHPSSTVTPASLCHLKVRIQQEDPSLNTPDRGSILKHGISLNECGAVLGKGSFGTVIRGKYKGECVAVKVVQKHKYYTSNASLRSEANAVHLSHHNIIKVLKVVEGQFKYGLVIMEHNIGNDMQKLIHNPAFVLNTENQIKYALDIGLALDYCHNLNVLHLDVKPKNILLCYATNTCKLCDFGSSVRVNDIGNEQLNMCINTPAYTDPEVLMGRRPTIKSDIYSFGITLWQFLSRSTPYEGEDIHVVIYKVVSQAFRPHNEGNVGYCDDFVCVYKQCWSQEPSKRPCAVGVIQELQKMHQRHSVQNCQSIHGAISIP